MRIKAFQSSGPGERRYRCSTTVSRKGDGWVDFASRYSDFHEAHAMMASQQLTSSRILLATLGTPREPYTFDLQLPHNGARARSAPDWS